MKATTFLLTLGVGMAAGGAVALMLPEKSTARKAAQKAVDKAETKMAQVLT
ncbi:MAG: hypothetical protein IKT58_05880 [Oscillospiraceae bacterium]|nr:hypothetical protein [Oscillospiraceae bacterium]